jgi:hypothetical protein
MRHPVDYAPSQDYGDNPTRNLPADHWIIRTFGNYQPDGHTGIDYPCPSGTPVRAVTAGKVLHVGTMGGTYASNPWWIQPSFAGYFYVVDHGWFIAIYGHCLAGGARVTIGQQVAEGQVLGLSGNTGASTGDHLHFEILIKPFVLNSRMYGRANPAALFGDILPQGAATSPQGTTTSEEDDMFTDQDRGVLNAANINADTARSEATNAKLAAQAAPGLAVQTLLSTRLPAPDGSGEFTIAEYLLYGWMYSMQAKDTAAAMGSIDADAVAAAVVAASQGADVQALADRLQITVKEG